MNDKWVMPSEVTNQSDFCRHAKEPAGACGCKERNPWVMNPAVPDVAVAEVHGEPGTSGEGATGGTNDNYPLDE